ncbi:hypothetical protein FSP39_011765 [Pinctada imbricata]|uniref:TFIIS N-terminal domain-containing protein n=1 Tax=Pinctada imbricata TaxID=66713 RepID=A0AA88XRE3_PINIB|nr:hypothetical protein FSP39_011765 [Pinctada imbricata]
MTCEEDVLKIGKKLEKMISSNSADHGGAEDLLKKLQDLPMTLAVLQKTRIGMTVNNFRKASSKDEVIVLAKGLIKSWKKLLPADSGGNSKPEKDKKERPKESQNGSPEQSMETETGSDKSSSGQGDNPTLTRQNSTASITNDPVRLKCRELIANALKTEEEVEGAGTPEDIGPKVEDGILDIHDQNCNILLMPLHL